MTSAKTVALMWSCEGLEAAVCVTDIKQTMLLETLKTGRRQTQMPNLLHWRLRAQANPQRHYEIYLIGVEPDITVETIREAFESSPQHMADTVRRLGHEFYSDRASHKPRIQ